MLCHPTQHTILFPHDDRTNRPNLALVKGSRGCLAIDAGNSFRHASAFLDELGITAPDYVVLTHSHWDHSFGLRRYHDSISIATAEADLHLREMMLWKWDDAAMRSRVRTGVDIKFSDTYIRREYQDPGEIEVVPVVRTFTGSLTLDLGGVHCNLLQIENSHSDDGCVVLVPEDKMLFCGDIHGDDFHHGWPPKQYLGKLEILVATLASLPFDTVVTGHDDVQDRSTFMDMLEDLLKRVRARDAIVRQR